MDALKFPAKIPVPEVPRLEPWIFVIPPFTFDDMVKVWVPFCEFTCIPVPPFTFKGIEKFIAIMVPLSEWILSKALVGGMFRYGPSA